MTTISEYRQLGLPGWPSMSVKSTKISCRKENNLYRTQVTGYLKRVLLNESMSGKYCLKNTKQLRKIKRPVFFAMLCSAKQSGFQLSNINNLTNRAWQ